MKILVTGADGLVGTHYLNYSRQVHDFLCPKETEMDITDPEQVEKYISENKPECLINFAAYTDTKNSELQRNNEEGSAWKINVGGVKNLAKVCKEKNIFFIQISTDLIFSGKVTPEQMYFEEENYSSDYEKISWYGFTKLEGEKALIGNGGDYAIVRIAYPFTGAAHTKKDMLHNIINLYENDALYPMFDDNTITPTYINDLSKALNRIIEGHRTGTYHVVSHDPVSHYNFAKYVLDKYAKKPFVLEQGSIKEFAQKSGIPRPPYINLDTTKTEKELNIKFGTWRQNVDEALKLLEL